jgi:hypothetical protein
MYLGGSFVRTHGCVGEALSFGVVLMMQSSFDQVSKPRHQPHKQLCLSSSSSSKQQELLGSLCKQWVQRGQPAGDKGSWQLDFWQQQVLAPVLSQR